MNSGIFCRTKNSIDVHNNILIDEYRKCIFGEAGTETLKDTSVAVSVLSSETPRKMPKWEVGMNVRAPYHSDDSTTEYYEAKIVKIFDDKFAQIEFHGYDDEHVIKLEELEMSRGKEAIEEQIAFAELEYEDDESDMEEVEWRVGMPCRAYYEPMDVIYEATIEEVDSAMQTANVSVIGYSLKYTVNFCDLYKSDPSLRKKQIKSAEKYHAKDQLANDSEGHESSPYEFRSPDAVNPRVCSPEHYGSRQCKSTCIPDAPHHIEDNIVRPKDEKEALACLISANYLCGYYAGYYDCLKKAPMKTHRDTSTVDGPTFLPDRDKI